MKSLPFVLGALVACGGAQTTPDNPTNGGGGSSSNTKPAAAGDVAFEVGPIEIKGIVFEPEALGRPGMPLVEPKKKTTLPNQRTVFASQKDPVQKQAHAAILATMLYQKSKEDKANEKALWTEARQALRDAAAAAKGKPDEITLRLLGSYELLLEDFAAAEQAWSALVTQDPKNKETPYHRAWWAFSLLKQFKNADALAVLKADSPSEKQPELAYVIAWSKWRTGDESGAWSAMVAAAKGWGSNAGKDALERDVFLFAGRARSVSLATVTPQLFGVFGAKQPAQQYEALAKLGLQSYPLAGRWSDGLAALDQAITVAGSAVPANDLPIIRYQQADFAVRLDKPEVSAKYGKQSVEAMPACGTKCAEKDKQDMIYGLYGIGRLFHVLYATANDIRYHQPAKDLYMLTVSLLMDATKRADAQKDMGILEATLKNTKAGTGTHDKGAIGALLNRHNQEVQACYETALSANPKIGGKMIVDLEVDLSGAVKGVATDPKAGIAEMSAVAACISDYAKTWTLPKRGMKGTTRIKLTYTMAPRK